MANVPLKSITFPGLTDTYTVPQIDSELATAGKAADAKAVGDQIGELKSDLDVISYIPKDICYVTDGAEGTVHGVHYEKAGRNVLKFTGTASALRYIVVFQGKNGTSNNSTSSPSHNLPQGTYTFFFTGTRKNKLDVCMTTATYADRDELTNGQTVTVGEDGACVFVKTYQSANYGTDESPTILTLEIYEGVVKDRTPTWCIFS